MIPLKRKKRQVLRILLINCRRQQRSYHVRLSRQLWCGLVWHNLSTLMYSRCFSELVWTERSDDSRLLKYPSHCYMHIQACGHTEIEQVEREMATRVFFINSFYMVFSWLWRRKHKQRLVSTHFWGYSWGTGMSYHTSPIPGLLWMLFQLPTSFPPVTPGCCEPNPLLSSVVGAQRGKARPRGTQQCVSRVRGLAPLFPRRWNTSSSQGGESGRGERIPPWNCCTVFFIRSWLNNQEIKSQKELNSHSLVCMVELLRFSLLMNTFMFSVIVYECFYVMFCFFKTKMTHSFNQSQR